MSMQGITEPNENTVGYFLKEIRRKYCLDQKDLCGGNVKRSKIAKIEINDVNTALTEEYAKEIAENINIVIKKYAEEVDYLYFFDNALYNIKQEATECAAEISMYYTQNDYGSFTNLLYKFINEYSQYNIPEIKLKVFILAARYSYQHKEFHKSYIYYNRAVDNAIACNNYDKLIYCRIQFYTCLALMGDCKEGITYIKQILKEEKDLTQEHKYFIHHRIGHAYLMMKDYSSALLSFEKASKYVDTTNIFYVGDLYVNKAFCYRSMLKLPEAIETLKAGLEYLNTDLYEKLKFRFDLFGNNLYYTKLSLANNIVCAYRYLNDKESMNHYLKEQLIVMESINDKMGFLIIDLYCDLFDNYMYLGDFDAADIYITKAFTLSINQENSYYQNFVLKKMVLVYEQMGDREKTDKLFPSIKSTLIKYPDKINSNSIVFAYFSHYFETNHNNLNNII
jgi:transcriptional regulator with XRE-family HTH domain